MSRHLGSSLFVLIFHYDSKGDPVTGGVLTPLKEGDTTRHLY